MKTKILLIDDDSNELIVYKDALSQICGAAKCDYAKEVGDALSMVKKSRHDPGFYKLQDAAKRQPAISICAKSGTKPEKCTGVLVWPMDQRRCKQNGEDTGSFGLY